jgi:PAS domain S-box-containing protein
MLPGDALDAVLRRAPIMVFAIDGGGVCTFCAGAGLRLLGVRQDEIVGRDLRQMYADEPGIAEQLRRALAGEEFGAVVARPGGPSFETWWVPRRDAAGRLTGSVGVGIDVTEVTEARRLAEQATDRQRGLLVHLHEAQEGERRRIAGEIHDDIIPVLAAVNLRLQGLRKVLLHDREPEKSPGSREVDLVALIDPLDAAVRQATDRLRAGLVELDPPPIADTGIGELLKQLAARVLASHPVEWSVTTEVREQPGELVGRILLRIAREALINVAKHAQATHIEVEVGQEAGHYRLRVADDGVGLGGHPAGPSSVGLRQMVDRAESAGGWCHIQELPAGGTEVTAGLPVRVGFPDGGPSLAEIQTFLQQTMESITDAYIAVDAQWRYIYANSAAYRMLNRDPSQSLIGANMWEEFQIAPEFEAAYRRAAAEQVPIELTGYYGPWDKWIENRIFPTAGGLSIFGRDVTEQMRAKVAPDEAGRQVEHGSRVVRALTAEPELAAALRAAAEEVVSGWRLSGAVLTVTATPGRDRLVIRVGDLTAPALARTTRPLVLGGRHLGSLELVRPRHPVEDELVQLFALRIAAES